MNFFVHRKQRKQSKELLHHCQALLNIRKDILTSIEREKLLGIISSLKEARQSRDSATLSSALEAATDAVIQLQPAHPWGNLREIAETLVVAFGVAMAFRAYFFQPFKIPTGSMQPTLYGIHSMAFTASGDPITPTWWDRMPGKPFKWVATGQWYREVVATDGGGVRVYTDRARAPGYVFVTVRGKKYKVPQDAFDRGEINIPNRQSAGMADSGDLRVTTVAQGTAQRGEKIWAGYVMAGDHVFVNRMKWNFFPPRRGQIMVFATDDIPNLNPGEHYIKRMAGLPGETIGIDPPHLMVDGLRVNQPETILKVTEKRAAWEGGPHYPGYTYTGVKAIGAQIPGGDNVICPLGLPGDTITLDHEQYLALGDNTRSSYDSRYWGPVPRKRLVGPASCIYWPWSPRWGGVQ